MNTLKGWITTLLLTVTLMASTAYAGGVIIGGRGNNQPCAPSPVKQKVDSAVIISGITGVIIGGFAAITGVIIGGALPVNAPVENCGVIIGG